MQPSGLSDEQPASRRERGTASGMGYRLAAGGLASRRGVHVRPAVPAVAASEQTWEPILPEQWSQSRIVSWVLSFRSARAGRPRSRARWSWLHSETIYQAAFLTTASAMVLTMMLYWGKSHAALVDGEIGKVVHQTQEARANTYLLRAEWATQNDPGRLKPLADRYLAMKRIDPAQFVDPAKLPDRLDHPPPPPAPDAPVQADPAVAADAPAKPDVQTASAEEPSPVVEDTPAPKAPVPTVSASPKIFRVAARSPVPAHQAAVAPAAPTASPIAARAVHHAVAAIRPDLPHWLTQAHLAPHIAGPRIMSEPPHTLSIPASMGMPMMPLQPPMQVHRYNAMASAPLPPLRRPSFTPYGASAPAYAEHFEPPPYMGQSSLGDRSYVPPPTHYGQ